MACLPNEHSNLIGLSKYARLVDWIMGRPQIQEEAVTSWPTNMEKDQPDGLAIVMEATTSACPGAVCATWTAK